MVALKHTHTPNPTHTDIRCTARKHVTSSAHSQLQIPCTHTHRSKQLPSTASVPTPLSLSLSFSLSSIHRADKSPQAMPLINYSELQRATAPQGLKISSVFHIPLTGACHPAASSRAWLRITRAQKTFYLQNMNEVRVKWNGIFLIKTAIFAVKASHGYQKFAEEFLLHISLRQGCCSGSRAGS